MADSFSTNHHPRSVGEGRGKRWPSRHQPHGGNPRASFASSTHHMSTTSRNRDGSPMPDSPPYNAGGRGSQWSSNQSSYHTQQRYILENFRASLLFNPFIEVLFSFGCFPCIMHISNDLLSILFISFLFLAKRMDIRCRIASPISPNRRLQAHIRNTSLNKHPLKVTCFPVSPTDPQRRSFAVAITISLRTDVSRTRFLDPSMLVTRALGDLGQDIFTIFNGNRRRAVREAGDRPCHRSAVNILTACL